MENLFVSAVLLLSGGYIWKRLKKTSGFDAGASGTSGCDDCGSGCGPQPTQEDGGEQMLPMR